MYTADFYFWATAFVPGVAFAIICGFGVPTYVEENKQTSARVGLFLSMLFVIFLTFTAVIPFETKTKEKIAKIPNGLSIGELEDGQEYSLVESFYGGEQDSLYLFLKKNKEDILRWYVISTENVVDISFNQLFKSGIPEKFRVERTTLTIPPKNNDSEIRFQEVYILRSLDKPKEEKEKPKG